MRSLNLEMKFLLLVGFLAIAFSTAMQASDQSYQIKITKTFLANQIEIFGPQNSRIPLYQNSLSRRQWSLSRQELQSLGELSNILQDLSVDSIGVLTVKSLSRKSNAPKISIKTRGQVNLEGYYSNLNLLADSVVADGLTTIEATNQFKVNNFTQASGTLSMGNGLFQVDGTFTQNRSATLKTLDKMHMTFCNLNNLGQIQADDLSIILKSSVALGNVHAKTLTFQFGTAVNLTQVQ